MSKIQRVNRFALPFVPPQNRASEVFGRVAAQLVLATLQVAAPRGEAIEAAQELLRSWVETRWIIVASYGWRGHPWDIHQKWHLNGDTVNIIDDQKLNDQN